MAAKELKDELVQAMAVIDSEAKAKMEKARKDAQAAVGPLRSKVDDYFVQLHAKADAPFKLKELSEGRVRAMEHLDKVGTDEDANLEHAAQAMSEIENAIGWVEPKPVDAKVIEEVKKRDRAADMASREAKGVGIKKE
ncbi:MAG: hypothetical protein WC375_05250 [Methanomassiliicoccales archaeon]|jgi:hypothetical protein